MKKNTSINISSNNILIRNHTVFGKRIMPGMAYIDFIYQMCQYADIDYRQLSINNLAIINPMIFEEDETLQINVVFEDKNNGWFVIIQDKEENKKYITATLIKEEKVYYDNIQVSQLKNQANETIEFESIYDYARQHKLVHEGPLKGIGEILLFDSEVLIYVSVSQHEESTEQYLYHPTLLDAAVMAGGSMRGDSEDKDNLYLPICFEYFYCTERLDNCCWIRMKKSTVKSINEIRTSDFEIYNCKGRKIGDLRGVTSRIVKSAIQSSKGLQENSEKMEYYLENSCENEIENRLIQLFAKSLSKNTNDINVKQGFFELGLESSQLLLLHQDIEAEFKIDLHQTLLFEHTTIQELAKYISQYINRNNNIQIDSCQNGISEELTKNIGDNKDIAIIGMAGYFPEADNIEEFWKNLVAGKDCVSEVPIERWDFNKYEDIKTPSGKKISKWGGFLNDVKGFDAEFFRISPREAEILDPQERLFLQCSWKAIEDAGYTPENIVKRNEKYTRKDVGVFVGVMHKDYALVGLDVVNEGNVIPMSLNYAPIANRVSYFCNFHGPSIVFDTVCSSSLISVHYAIKSIQDGECEVALAGGVNLSLHPAKYISYGLAGMHSSDGRCRSLGEGGDGYVSSEGVGAVLLKPLDRAKKDKDHIYAVIKGSAINHGGAASGITVPNPVAQKELILECLEKTGINPETISYVEAHGTGTALGDPIEIKALTDAYSMYTKNMQYCAIGSVKSNIGHTESAAGIIGLIKVALQLYYKELVPSLHAEKTNQLLDLENTPFYICKEHMPWELSKITIQGEEDLKIRRAAINSFGATGMNAHLILEEYIDDDIQGDNAENDMERYCILLSARSQKALVDYAINLLNFTKKAKDAINFSMNSLAYTLQTGRTHFEVRKAFIVKTVEELQEKLEDFINTDDISFSAYSGKIEQNNSIVSLLSSNIDAKKLIDIWIKKRQLEIVVQLWINGVNINWETLYEDIKPNKLSLPTYPFDLKPHWLKNTEKEQDKIIKNNDRQETILERISREIDIAPVPDSLKLFNAFSSENLDEVFKTLLAIFGENIQIENKYLEISTFSELGVDMIIGNKIREQINNKYQLKISQEDFFNCKTIRELAEVIIKKR